MNTDKSINAIRVYPRLSVAYWSVWSVFCRGCFGRYECVLSVAVAIRVAPWPSPHDSETGRGDRGRRRPGCLATEDHKMNRE